MEIEGRAVALEVTSLPVGQNMRQPATAAVIRGDIAAFLNHHDFRSDAEANGRGRKCSSRMGRER